MRHKEILKRVAEELDLPEDLVIAVYKSYWSYVKTTLENFDIRDKTKEEFEATRHSINIPSLGKFFSSYERDLWLKNNRHDNKEN